MYKKITKTIILFSIVIVAIISFGFTAKFSLVSINTGKFIVNCPYNIDVMIDTKGQKVTASDMILEYNKKNLDIVGFKAGDFFSLNWGLQRKDNYIFSTAINYPEPVSGVGKFGELVIIPKHTGINNINFVVDKISPESTRDTNIAYQGKDYLSEVSNISFDVYSGYCSNKNIDKSDFIEYDSNISYKEFEKKRNSKLKHLEYKSVVKSIIKILSIRIFIFVLVLFVKYKINENKK